MVQPQSQIRNFRLPETGLQVWEWRSKRAAFQFRQRAPGALRRHYQGRGPDESSLTALAGYCVFQLRVENLQTAPDAHSLHIDLREWRTEHRGERQAPLLDQEWLALWEGQNDLETKPAAHSRDWFPSELTLGPGETGEGMIGFRPPPGSWIDIEFTWHQDGVSHQVRLYGVRCARAHSLAE